MYTIYLYIIIKRLGQHVYLLEGGLAVVLYPAVLAQECGGQPNGQPCNGCRDGDYVVNIPNTQIKSRNMDGNPMGSPANTNIQI